MNEVFILGAGFSRAVSRHMPLMRDLPKLIFERYRHADALPIDIRKRINDNVEMALAYLLEGNTSVPDKERDRNQRIFRDLVLVIRGLFIEYSRDPSIWGSNNPPEWLEALITHWNRNHSTVISFNYDTLIERVAGSIYSPSRSHSIETGDLYSIALLDATRRGMPHVGPTRSTNFGNSFVLLKLHGSANWFYQDEQTNTHGPIFFVPCMGGLDGTFDAMEGRDPEAAHWNNLQGTQPVIIPPVSNKSGFFRNPEIRSQWKEAERRLSAAHKVYCLGYSMPESDGMVADLIRKHLPSGVPLQLVNLANQLDHFQKTLGLKPGRITQVQTGLNCIPIFVIQSCVANADDRFRLLRTMVRSIDR